MLRQYSLCEENLWTVAERDIAERLLAVLGARGRQRLQAARLTRAKVHATEDAWPWPPAGPEVPGEVAAAVAQVRGQGVDEALLVAVAGRLRGEMAADENSPHITDNFEN